MLPLACPLQLWPIKVLKVAVSFFFEVSMMGLFAHYLRRRRSKHPIPHCISLLDSGAPGPSSERSVQQGMYSGSNTCTANGSPQVFYISSLGIFIVSLDCTYYRSGPKTNEASTGRPLV